MTSDAKPFLPPAGDQLNQDISNPIDLRTTDDEYGCIYVEDYFGFNCWAAMYTNNVNQPQDTDLHSAIMLTLPKCHLYVKNFWRQYIVLVFLVIHNSLLCKVIANLCVSILKNTEIPPHKSSNDSSCHVILYLLFNYLGVLLSLLHRSSPRPSAITIMDIHSS